MTERRVCEVGKGGFAGFAPGLLGVFPRGPTHYNGVTFAVRARHRLARSGETETFVAPYSVSPKAVGWVLVTDDVRFGARDGMMLLPIEKSLKIN